MEFSAAVDYYAFEGRRILTTNDAYYYAAAARDLAGGHILDSLQPQAVLGLVAALSAALYFILPLDFDALFFLMPVFLSSLLALPVFFFAKSLTNRYVGFFAAALCPLCAGFLNRTLGGYYDTDMLILFFPLCGLYFLFRLLGRFSLRDSAFAALFFLLSLLWHRASATSLLFLALIIALFFVFFKDLRNHALYEALGVLIVAISDIWLPLQIVLIFAMFHFMVPRPLFFAPLTAKIVRRIRHKSAFMLCFGFAVFAAANAEQIGSRISTYVFGETIAPQAIHLKATANAIEELQTTTVATLASATVGDDVVFWAGLFGALLLFFREPRTLILLPFFILSLASLKMGHRFTLFGAPIISIGFFYLLFVALGGLRFAIKDVRFLRGVRAILLLFVGGFVLISSHYRAKNAFLAPVVQGYEIAGLESIAKASKSRDDVAVSWWDFGYLVSYFANARSIASGGELDGSSHFISSFILAAHSPQAAHNMAKLAAWALDEEDEKYEKLSNLNKILRHFGGEDSPKKFMQSLESADFQAPKLAHEVYLYLPLSLLATQTALDEYSDIDYDTGEVIHKEREKTLAQYFHVQNEGEKYVLNGEIEFDPKTGVLYSRALQKSQQVQKFHIVGRGEKGKNRGVGGERGESGWGAKGSEDNKRGGGEKSGVVGVTTTSYNDDKSKLHIVYNQNLGAFFAIDDWTNGALAVQMLVYERYDEGLFEPLYADKYSRAFRLK